MASQSSTWDPEQARLYFHDYLPEQMAPQHELFAATPGTPCPTCQRLVPITPRRPTQLADVNKVWAGRYASREDYIAIVHSEMRELKALYPPGDAAGIYAVETYRDHNISEPFDMHYFGLPGSCEPGEYRDHDGKFIIL